MKVVVGLFREIARDFVSWGSNRARMIDEGECIASVLLAIGFAHMMGALNVGWAAFSGYMVLRSSFCVSLSRGVLRILGTILGAAAAWWLVAGLEPGPILLSLALALVGGANLYLALVQKSGYGWLFAGLTFCMVAIEGTNHHASDFVATFAESRILEVLAGTLACMVVSGISSRTLRGRLAASGTQQTDTANRTGFIWHGAALRHACQGAAALALIPPVRFWFGVPELSQSGITILAVMMAPLTTLGSAFKPTSIKLLHRCLGCAIGGVAASSLLLVGRGDPIFMTIAVCAGVAVGRHIENGPTAMGYVGTQFVLAFLVVLVPDNYHLVDIRPGIERLVGITFGIVLLEPVLVVFHAMSRSRHAPSSSK